MPGAHSACSDGTLVGIHHPVVAGISLYSVGSLARYYTASFVDVGGLSRCSFLPTPSGSFLAYPGIHHISGPLLGALVGPDSHIGAGYQTARNLGDRGWALTVVISLVVLPRPRPEVRSFGPASYAHSWQCNVLLIDIVHTAVCIPHWSGRIVSTRCTRSHAGIVSPQPRVGSCCPPIPETVPIRYQYSGGPGLVLG